MTDYTDEFRTLTDPQIRKVLAVLCDEHRNTLRAVFEGSTVAEFSSLISAILAQGDPKPEPTADLLDSRDANEPAPKVIRSGELAPGKRYRAVAAYGRAQGMAFTAVLPGDRHPNEITCTQADGAMGFPSTWVATIKLGGELRHVNVTAVELVDDEPLCLGCHKPFTSPDHDPRCSACVESGTGEEPKKSPRHVAPEGEANGKRECVNPEPQAVDHRNHGRHDYGALPTGGANRSPGEEPETLTRAVTGAHETTRSSHVGQRGQQEELGRDPAIILAAEGVTLEPGEYELVTVDDTDPRLKPGDVARPEKLAAVKRLTTHYNGTWGWLFLDGGPSTWVTAVRRVEPTSATDPEMVQQLTALTENVSEIESALGNLTAENTKLRARFEAAERELSKRNLTLQETASALGMGSGDKLSDAPSKATGLANALADAEHDAVKQLQKARIYGEMAFKWRERCINGGLAREDERIEATEYQGLLEENARLRARVEAAERREQAEATGYHQARVDELKSRERAEKAEQELAQLRERAAGIGSKPAAGPIITSGELEVGRRYRSEKIHESDGYPAHKIGDVVTCNNGGGEGLDPKQSVFRGGWLCGVRVGHVGGTWVTAVSLEPDAPVEPAPRLYIPKPDEIVRVVAVAPDDTNPDRENVGKVVVVRQATARTDDPSWIWLCSDRPHIGTGTWCRVEPVAASAGMTVDPLPSPAGRTTSLDALIAGARAERDHAVGLLGQQNARVDELRAKIAELEAQPSGKYFAMLRRAMVPRWKTCSSWAEAIKQVEQLCADVTRAGTLARHELDEELQKIDDAVVAAGGEREQGGVAFISQLRASLTATEGERDEQERAAKERISGLEAQLETMGNALQTTEESAHREVERLHEQLSAQASEIARLKTQLATAVDDCGFAVDGREAAVRNGQTLSAEIAQLREELAKTRCRCTVPRPNRFDHCMDCNKPLREPREYEHAPAEAPEAPCSHSGERSIDRATGDETCCDCGALNPAQAPREIVVGEEAVTKKLGLRGVIAQRRCAEGPAGTMQYRFENGYEWFDRDEIDPAPSEMAPDTDTKEGA